MSKYSEYIAESEKILFPEYQESKKDSNKDVLKMIEDAIALYHQRMGRFPSVLKVSARVFYELQKSPDFHLGWKLKDMCNYYRGIVIEQDPSISSQDSLVVTF